MKKLLPLVFLFSSLIAVAQPGNDECSSATEITISSSYYPEYEVTGSFDNATASAGPEVCDGTVNDDIWFRFTAAAPRHRMNLYGGSPHSRAYVVYKNSCSGDIVTCGIYGVYGKIMLNDLMPGEDYYIRFYRIGGSPTSDNITISITSAAEPMQLFPDYTTQELIYDTVCESMPPLVSVTNITKTSGNDFGDVNGIVFFSAFEFPINDGVILSTGNFEEVTGPNSSLLGAGTPAWPGDADLEAILGPDDPGGFVNASSLEYDFTTTIDELNELGFSFIFASEDYGAGQCGPSDAFAIIITNLDTGVKTNLAVIPGTEIPVNVNTVRDIANNPDCPSANEMYFDEYFADGDTFSLTNFNGRTKRFDVEYPIESATTYHIKFVIADRGDTGHDSAVFINANINLGEPALAPTAVSPQQFTEGETLADIEVEGENIQWYAFPEGGEPLPAGTLLEDNTTYYASQTVNGTESQERTPVLVFITLSNPENSLSQLTGYPNPVHNILNFSDGTDIDRVVITDVFGHTVLQKNKIDSPVDVSGLAAGMYFVKAISGQVEKTIKIIKQ